MTTQKQWHGSPGGTLTITSSLSQSLRWLMKRKSKGQLWYSGAPPSSSYSLTWTRWESPLKCRRWSLQSSGDGISLISCTQKSKYESVNSSLAFKLPKYQKRMWKSSLQHRPADKCDWFQFMFRCWTASTAMRRRWRSSSTSRTQSTRSEFDHDQTTAPRSEQNTIKTIMNL